MNKQEGLEALLEQMRRWEERGAEVRRLEELEVWELADRAMAAIALAHGREEVAAVNDLITVGAAALYLLVDEVEVVQGQSLDAWLAGAPVYSLPPGVLPGPGAAGGAS